MTAANVAVAKAVNGVVKLCPNRSTRSETFVSNAGGAFDPLGLAGEDDAITAVDTDLFV